MTRFRLLKVYYTPGVDVVSIAVQAIDGPFRDSIKDLYSSQERLEALAANRTGGAVPWTDDDVRVEANALLAELGAELE